MRKISILSFCAILGQGVYAQQEIPLPDLYNPVITTGVPFLLINADARSAGMGDMGVATSPDAFSQQHNAAKYAFSEKQQGFAISYTPYMASVASDISLAQLNYFNKVNDRMAFAGSFRYFGLGDIDLMESFGSNVVKVSPNELALDVSGSLKLSETFSGAVTLRYINSNLKIPTGNESGSASAVAVDIAGYYQSEVMRNNNFDGRLRAGFAIQNIGPKIKYTDDIQSENFLPTNLRLGAGYDFILDQYNKISAYGEVTKLMVPSHQYPTYIDANNNGVQDANEPTNFHRNEYNEKGWFGGMFSSFGDAPGGFSEEMKEFTWALGGEYWYQDSFAFRLGYFHESEMKGARQYATLGAGFRYNIVNIDVSYLFATGAAQNPLENSLRFSLTFNFGKNSVK
ncbi:type IX secretion system outer membrane channel protein PorV [Flavobacterium sp. I3-2]|uniref:type IX secretion system outer membrane channel protein PorV n=1 Tax=Flavobacterium sp. I3-2 TaxID=2748319 RepID=UPI0015ABCA95|nr:type IX secretion system outer membrane channel protein PorV [Flavobacterium sp. I3-2]